MSDLTTADWSKRASDAVKERDAANAKLRSIAEAKDREARAARAKQGVATQNRDRQTNAWADAALELRQETRDREQAVQRAEVYARAFASFLRQGVTQMPSTQRTVLETGMRRLDDAQVREARALGVASGAVGGFLAPQSFFDRVVSAQKLVCPVRNMAFAYKTSNGAPMPVPMDADTANVGELISEITQAATLDTTLQSKTLGSYAYSSKVVLVNNSLVQDFAFDLDEWIAHKLGLRIGRIQNQHFTTGTGSGQPQGIVTGATLGKTGLVGETTTIIYDDLADLEHAVDPAYRGGRQLVKGLDDNNLGPSPAWMMADSSLKAVQKVKDSQNRPLWQAGLSADAPDRILGYPVVINNDMATMAASAKSVLFGDMSSYVIRDAGEVFVLRLTERFADYAQTGFLAFARADAAVLDPGSHPLTYFANSAT